MAFDLGQLKSSERSLLQIFLQNAFRRFEGHMEIERRPKLFEAAPVQPEEGQIVRADGSSWDPGSGRGYYGYDEGLWKPFNESATTYKTVDGLLTSSASYPEGTVLFAAKEGISYIVAATTATNHHLTTSPGGVKLYVQPRDGKLLAAGFGCAAGLSAAVNTTAIQTAINVASNTGIVFVILPDGEIATNKLYLHYDATNNPGFNSAAQAAGRIILRGAGRSTYTSYLNDEMRGTILTSDDSTGSAVIYAYNTQLVRIEDLSMVVDNTTLAIKLERAPQNSGLSNVLVVQESTGGGIVMQDIWNTNTENVFVNDTGSGTGQGFYAYNENVGGGFNKFETVNVNGFDNALVFGHLTRSSAKLMYETLALNCQGAEATNGITIAGGIMSSVFMLHAEDSTLGMRFINLPRSIKVFATMSGNDKDCEIGSTTAAECYYECLDLTLICLSQVAEQLEIYTSTTTRGVTLRHCRFTGDGSTTLAVKLENDTHHYLRVIDPTYNSVITEINYPDLVNEYLSEDLYQVNRGGTGGAASDPMIVFKQTSAASTVPVVEVNQKDNDVGFIRFKTHSPIDGSLENITTKVGTGTVVGPKDGSWAISYMVLQEVQDQSGSPIEIWFPGYTAI